MKKGVKARLCIFNILYSIFNNKSNYDNIFYQECLHKKFLSSDKAMINNVALNSMRYYFHINKFIKKFIRKKINKRQFILLLSGIAQIIYLDFKDYAVVNCSVEVAKILKINPGFVNAFLKQIIKNKNELKKYKINFSDLPHWFLKNTENLSIEQKKIFIDNFYKTPNLHLVFKKQALLNNFKDKHFKTSPKSLVIKKTKKIEKISNYKKGDWWIQDYSSMLPLCLTPNLKGKKIIDLCAAPGGKAFQALSGGGELILNDISYKRNKLLKQNLLRLNYNVNVMQQNVFDISVKNKFDYVLLDAPCSAIGTIRRNPEIFFRNIPPNIDNLTLLQKKLLQKSISFLNDHGIIIYMVCSFFKKETYEQINFFLKNNKNFTISKFKDDSKEKFYKDLITKDGFLHIMPRYFNNYFIDGFFAAKLIKNA